MRNFFDTLFQLKHAVRLESGARARIRGNLTRMLAAETLIARRKKTFLGRFFPLPALASLVVVLLVGGSTSLAAEAARPGDFLYQMKVGFNEEVVASFSFTPEAKAQWEAVRAERRLGEITDLVAQGESASDLTRDVAKRFEEHAERVRVHLVAIEEKGEVQAVTELTSRLEASLSAHEYIFARLERVPDGGPQRRGEEAAVTLKAQDATLQVEERKPAPVEARVKEVRESLTKARKKVEKKVETRGNGRVKAVAEQRLRSAERALRSAEASLLKDERTRKRTLGSAAARLRAAQKVVERARTQLEAQAFGDAFAVADEAFRAAEETKVLMEAEARLHLNFFEELREASSSKNDGKSEIKSDVRILIDADTSHVTSTRGKDGKSGEDGKDGEDGKNGNGGDG